MSHLKLHTGPKSDPKPLLVPLAGLIVAWAETPAFDLDKAGLQLDFDRKWFVWEGHRYAIHDSGSTRVYRRAPIVEDKVDDHAAERLDYDAYDKAESAAKAAVTERAKAMWADTLRRQALVSWVGHAKEYAVHESVEEIDLFIKDAAYAGIEKPDMDPDGRSRGLR